MALVCSSLMRFIMLCLGSVIDWYDDTSWKPSLFLVKVFANSNLPTTFKRNILNFYPRKVKKKYLLWVCYKPSASRISKGTFRCRFWLRLKFTEKFTEKLGKCSFVWINPFPPCSKRWKKLCSKQNWNTKSIQLTIRLEWLISKPLLQNCFSDRCDSLVSSTYFLRDTILNPPDLGFFLIGWTRKAMALYWVWHNADIALRVTLP